MTKAAVVRIVTPLLVIMAVVSGGVGQLGYGGLCSLDALRISMADALGFLLRYLDLGRASVTFTCPLGFLERSLAAREWLPLWPPVALVVLSVVLLGRVFCAWVCPAGLVHRLVRGKAGLRRKREAAPKETIWAPYSSYAVLGGVLFASFLFRFPVFCFFCPIGLFFGALAAVIRLLSPDPLSLELALFPVMLALELVVLKSWCRSICPLGALLSIVGNLNPFWVPVLRKEKCLTSKGVNCGACARVCPEGIDLTKSTRFSPNSCTKCLECSDKCPVKAIEFPLWARKGHPR